MGCCQSNEEEKEYGDTVNERSRLINPVGEQPAHSINGETSVTPIPDAQPKGDDQSALTRILHKTARNVIDVAAIEGSGMEQHEFHDKARQYGNRVGMVLSSSSRQRVQKSPLPNGVSAPQIVLAAQPISPSDIDLITNAASKAAKAVKDVQVEHKEDLVVPFGVP